MARTHFHYTFLALALILTTGQLVLCDLEPESMQSDGTTTTTASPLLRALQSGFDSLQERIRTDLNGKFSLISSHLDETSRKVGKTLSLFEQEWNAKSERLNEMESRQQNVESVVMRLSRIVQDLVHGQNRLEQQLAQDRLPVSQSVVAVTPRLLRLETNTRIQTQESESEESEDEGEEDAYSFITNSTTYELRGMRSNYRRIKRIAPEDQGKLLSIELEYVEVVPRMLLESLQNCTSLKVLKMIHVKLTGDFNYRVVLPSLEKFVLHQDDIFQFSNQFIFTKWAEIDDYLQGFDKIALKSRLFFDKNGSWPVEEVSELNTDVDLTIDGLKIFEITHATGEVNTMLKFGNDIVKNLGEDSDFALRKLSVSSWRHDIDSFPATITHLNFNYVLLSNETDFKGKLSKFKSLESLNMFIGNRGEQSLAPFPPSLRNLTIRYTDLTYNPANYRSKLDLDFLYFHFCRMSPEFVENFPTFFNSNHTAVAFRRNDNSMVNNLAHKVLQKVLKTQTTWIFMRNFPREVTDAVLQDSDIRTLIVYREVEEFLRIAGVPDSAENFLLQKQDEGEWRGRQLSTDEVMFLTYQLAGTNKFVTFNTFKRLIEN